MEALSLHYKVPTVDWGKTKKQKNKNKNIKLLCQLQNNTTFPSIQMKSVSVFPIFILIQFIANSIPCSVYILNISNTRCLCKKLINYFLNQLKFIYILGQQGIMINRKFYGIFSWALGYGLKLKHRQMHSFLNTLNRIQ